MRPFKATHAALVSVISATALIAVTMFGGSSAIAASVNAKANSQRLLTKSMPISQAIKAVGRAAIVSHNPHIGSAALKTLLADDSTWADQDGRLFVVEPAMPAAAMVPDQGPLYTSVGGTLVVSGASGNVPLTEAFNLNSRPTSTKTIYLNFVGQTGITGTAWNGQYGTGTTFDAVPYDTDGLPASYNNAERAVIISVWQRVAEDYAPFDVNVTTQDPGLAAIDRAGSGDNVYGTTAMITSQQDMIAANCGCGGIAYVGVYNSSTSHQFYQPAWAFTRGLGGGTYAKYLAEAVSHEVGHNLGLSHDGTATVGYYQGQGSWAPIMGVGYYNPVAQWSKGEYSGANQLQDDLAVIQSYGLSLVADDYADTAAAATSIPSGSVNVDGLISTAADVDVFAFSTAGGTVTLNADPNATSPNLDIKLEIKDSTGAVVASADPAVATSTGDIATGLNASVSLTLAAGNYTAWVQGVGFGDPVTNGYSDYASLGRYTLTGSIANGGVVNAPVITGTDVSTAPAGGSVLINGSDLASATKVSLNGVNASFVQTSATQITATVPAGAASGFWSVTTPGGTAVGSTWFSVGAPVPTPTISSFTPTSGPVGTAVTITGTNFTGTTAVTFNGTSATFTVVSATSITTAVPSGATTGVISVTNALGTGSSATSFTVTVPTPTISSFTPTSGPVGTSVTITGTNFTGASAVSFNGTSATFTVSTATSIRATVPAGATTGRISVTTGFGTVTSTGSFTVTSTLPTITSFSPTSGPVGTSVTINGTNFTGTTSVKFGGVTATYTVGSATRITAVVPSGAVTGVISVTNATGTANSTGSFTVTIPAPKVSSFSPASGPVGTVVTISGSNFLGATGVRFNNTSAITFTVVNATTITATVPAGATTGRITVTTPGGSSTSNKNFTVK